VGKGPGRYNLYLGAAFAGERLGCLYRENINEQDIIDALSPLFSAFAAERYDDERFGDFLLRTDVVREVTAGRFFHHAPGGQGAENRDE
jgi:sulfite reductase (NADPH) hemoprotein beta-component